MSTSHAGALSWLRPVVDLIRQATGEAAWDAYVARCDEEGVVAMSRRDFERHRAVTRERTPPTGCCC